MELMKLANVEVTFDKNAEAKPFHANFFASVRADSRVPYPEGVIRDAILRKYANDVALFRNSIPEIEGIHILPLSCVDRDSLYERGFNTISHRPGYGSLWFSSFLPGTSAQISDVIVFASIIKSIVQSTHIRSDQPNVRVLSRFKHTVLDEPANLIGCAEIWEFAEFAEQIRSVWFDFMASRLLPTGYDAFKGEFVSVNNATKVVRVQTHSCLYVDFVLSLRSVTVFYQKHVFDLLVNLMDWDNKMVRN